MAQVLNTMIKELDKSPNLQKLRSFMRTLDLYLEG